MGIGRGKGHDEGRGLGVYEVGDVGSTRKRYESYMI